MLLRLWHAEAKDLPLLPVSIEIKYLLKEGFGGQAAAAWFLLSVPKSLKKARLKITFWLRVCQKLF